MQGKGQVVVHCGVVKENLCSAVDLFLLLMMMMIKNDVHCLRYIRPLCRYLRYVLLADPPTISCGIRRQRIDRGHELVVHRTKQTRI